MAVVQISKIQVRRGQKNSASGVPQLSSAEFAWAVDTQELFIGNGSVAEGAPYVGNTKVLTEHDNILELASSYQFASDDPSITASIPRPLQQKADEYVSVADFGAVGDGSTDCVAAFEAAFTQLFRNTDTTYRKVLKVPNGEYLFLSDLEVPSYVILEGETQEGAVLNIGASNIRLITENGTGLSNFSSTDRPRNVTISNLTIARTTGQTVLTGSIGSTIDRVKFLGNYQLGDSVSLSTEPAALFWETTIPGIKVTNIYVNNCVFDSNSISMKCNQTINIDTVAKIENCYFLNNDTGIYVVGTTNQETRWDIINSKFELIAKQAFRSTAGTGTRINSCRFINCGNDTNTAQSPVSPMVWFGQSENNVVVNCSSDRQQAAAMVSTDATPSVSEVVNGDIVNFVDRINSIVYLSDSFRPFTVLSAENKHFYIDYVLKLSVHTRAGRLTITIDDDFENVSLTDNYQYSSTSISHPGGTLMTNFEFSVSLKNNAATDIGDSSAAPETVVLYYKNPLSTGVTGTISFDVTYGV